MSRVARARVIASLIVLITSTISVESFAHKGTYLNDGASNRSAEQDAFYWHEQRKLTWGDFRGNLDMNEPDNTAAATYCGIGFEATPLRNSRKLAIRVYNTFFPNQSWVRQGEEKASILAHEQGHFDICELYTRKLKYMLDVANNRGENSEGMLKRIYDEVQEEYAARQERYEHETEHGLIAGAQQHWQYVIARELDDTRMLAWNR